MSLVRCSTDEQADTSPADQAAVLRAFGDEHGMVHAGDDVVLEGVSGSMPGNRDDIARIVARKQARDDFDVLLVQDTSRLTRGGARHGNAVAWELGKAGVEVVFVNEHATGDPEHDAFVQTLGFWAAQKMAKDLSYAATRGQMSSLAGGFIPHTSRIPYGVDRLYVGLDGTKRHRLRNLTDGTQQKLDPEQDVVLAAFGRNPKKGSPVHYRRQSDERILLVPGAPEQVEAVRQMYRRHLLDGWGASRIARELNDRGLPSPTGKGWSTDTVESVLDNPTYTGVGVCDRYASGIYHVRGGDKAPAAVRLDTKTVATRRKAPIRLRPRDHWKFQQHPLLVDYLGAELRERAVARHQRLFERQDRKAMADPKKAASARADRDKHAESPYVLKGLLKSAQGGVPMTGKLAGPMSNRTRYYALTRARHYPKSGSVAAKMVPAEPLERAVLGVVRDVLAGASDLRERVARILGEQQEALDGDRQRLEPIVAEREELREKLLEAMDLKPASRRLIQDRLDQWEARVADLEDRIAKASARSERPTIDVDAVADAVVERLGRLGESMEGMPPAAVRNVLASVVSKLVVDQETRDVDIELALPAEMLRGGGDGAVAPLCLDGARPWPSPHEAQRPEGLKIASVTCRGSRGDRYHKPCFACSRKAA